MHLTIGLATFWESYTIPPMGIKWFSIIALVFSVELVARPISYTGGSTAMLFSDNMKNSAYLHYSPSYKYSLGIELVKDKHFDEDYALFRYTYLLNRKNTQTSQRNLYFQSGIASDGVDNHFYGIHGDWETRRWFTGFDYKNVSRDNIDYTNKSFQIGVAPYLGDYGDLHTWIMLKTKKNSLQSEWSTYPVLKFFKGNLLFEVGYGKKTQWDAHLMVRF